MACSGRGIGPLLGPDEEGLAGCPDDFSGDCVELVDVQHAGDWLMSPSMRRKFPPMIRMMVFAASVTDGPTGSRSDRGAATTRRGPGWMSSGSSGRVQVVGPFDAGLQVTAGYWTGARRPRRGQRPGPSRHHGPAHRAFAMTLVAIVGPSIRVMSTTTCAPVVPGGRPVSAASRSRCATLSAGCPFAISAGFCPGRGRLQPGHGARRARSRPGGPDPRR